MPTQTLTTSADTVTIAQNGARIGTGPYTSLIGQLVDGLAGVDTLILDDRYPSGFFSLGAGNDGVVTMTTSSGVMQFQNFEKIQFSNATVNLGTTSNDTIVGTKSADAYLFGLAGNDSIDGGGGADKMYGGLGDDTYVVDTTTDQISELASAGTDLVQSSATFTLGDQIENLTLTGTLAINGTGNALNNTLIGNSGVNTLTGAGGDDTLDGGLGADILVGGAGNDTYIVNATAEQVTELSAGGTDVVKSSATVLLSANVENLILTGAAAINGTGNTLNNVMTGNTGANTLTGAAGADKVDGGAGNDKLLGGAGLDTLTGGAGSDTFVFNTAPAAGNVDRITDYNAAADSIQLENAIYTKLGAATGVISTAAFWVGTAAHDADDRIIYNKATGALYYDANGNAAGGQVQIAILANHAAITKADILII